VTVSTFVDTNVLAYAHDAADQRRQPIAAAVIDGLWRARDGVLSTQVLTEFYVVVTRKFDPPLSRRDARRLVDAYAAWPVVQVDPPLIIAASALEEQHSLSFWDALIIEAARRSGADRVLSEDLQHGRRIAGLVIENPFASVDS
jgi:predicted nucleic acid-binding protein